MNSLESLTRGNQDSATIEVDFKRKKDLKNTFLSGYADPAKLFKSLATLKQLGHPGYQLVVKKCLLFEISLASMIILSKKYFFIRNYYVLYIIVVFKVFNAHR